MSYHISSEKFMKSRKVDVYLLRLWIVEKTDKRNFNNTI